MTTPPASQTPFPSAGAAALAGLLATAMLLAVGTLVGACANALVTNVWKNPSSGMGWLVIVVNLVSHAAAIALAVILMKRFSGRRAQLLRLTILLMIGYAVIVFFSTLFQQMGTPVLIAVSNATQSGLRLLSFIVWFGVPAAIAAAILAFAGRTDRSTRS
jgi:hypothetical protein